MAKVSYTVGFTVNMGDYNSGRFEMRVDDIDPDGDVPAQLEKSHTALWQSVGWLQEQASVELAKLYRKKITEL